MKAEPLPGDWCKLVQKDFEDINLIITEDQIRSMSPADYKSIINRPGVAGAVLQLPPSLIN